jgi:glutamyl/glutaminyl-tRNA synthetase
MSGRIAPTPSGYPHLGNAINFAANALLAGREGVGLLLRIDDLDRQRVRPEYLEDVFETLHWLGIRWTTGPTDVADFLTSWSQEHRMELYAAALDQLRTRVFACPCSRKELANGRHAYDCPSAGISLDRPGVAWRIDTRGMKLHERMPDFAVRKKDGRPSYQLACTVDDLHFGVTHCVRGEDLRDSTVAQSLLSDLLGYQSLYERMTVLHHPLLEVNGQKMSKSQGAPTVRESGWEPVRIFREAGRWLVRATP